MIRTLIVDDHPLVRSGLRAVLATADDVDVVGEAATGEEAVQLATALQPDVVVMDLSMPGIGGVEATRRIVEATPHVHVLVLTLFENDGSLLAALRAGARGYLLKEANEVEVLRAIRTVSSGDALIGGPMARRLAALLDAPRPVAPLPFPELTEREREILTWMAQGLSNADIAQALAISVKTVRNYSSTIFDKLQVADRVQAVLRAREAGLGHARGDNQRA